MDLTTYLQIFRRRWLLLVVPALCAVAVAFLTAPQPQTATTASATYTAKATLIASPTYTTAGQPPVQMADVALFTSLGSVPRRAARRLGYHGEPQVLASTVEVTPDTTTNTLAISSTGPDRRQVAARVNAFASATVQFFTDQQRRQTGDRISTLNRQLGAITRQTRRVQARLASSPDDPVLSARLASLQSQYSTQFGEIGDLRRSLGASGPLEVLQPGVAIPLDGGGFEAPRSPLVRLGIAGLLGLLLGAALALLVERMDSRLRTRDQVEDAFGLPVLAEIPALSYGRRRVREIVSAERPASATAEAHRALRSAVLLLGPHGSPDGIGGQEAAGSLVVLVTSALPGEGKTTTVANLAAVMAEAGRRVVVVSLDLRSPRLHEYFGLENGSGVSDLLAADRAGHLAGVLKDTHVPGVRVATSGQELAHPGALVASARPLLDQARRLGDVVLVDTAPMLTVSDAVDLAPYVDVAIVVSRLNRTTTTQAASSRRLLSRLGVPALGTVLVGSRGGGRYDGYRAGPPRARRTGQPTRH